VTRVATATFWIMLIVFVEMSSLVLADPKPGATIIDQEFSSAPGVETVVHSYDSHEDAQAGLPGAGTGTSTPSLQSSETDGPLIVGLSAHNCTPYTTPAGIGLGLDLGEAGSGDCLSFSAPDPVQRLVDRGGPRSRGGRGPSLEELIRTAADRAIALAISPELKVAPDGVGLTGLPSYFWLAQRPQPISATAGAGGVTVTAEAYPTQYVWTFGDGEDLVTTTSGRPWTRDVPGNIEYTYETRGRYDLSVEVIYRARWRVDGGPWQSLGFFSTSDLRTYPVRQVVAVLVRP
jgi:hypothetical protein